MVFKNVIGLKVEECSEMVSVSKSSAIPDRDVASELVSGARGNEGMKCVVVAKGNAIPE